MSCLSSETKTFAFVYKFSDTEFCSCCGVISKRHVVKSLTKVSFPRQLQHDFDKVDRERKYLCKRIQ